MDIASRFHREMLELEHPGWRPVDLKNYLEWEAANQPRLWDHVTRLWRTIREHDYARKS